MAVVVRLEAVYRGDGGVVKLDRLGLVGGMWLGVMRVKFGFFLASPFVLVPRCQVRSDAARSGSEVRGQEG